MRHTATHGLFFAPRITGLLYVIITALLGLAAAHSQVNLLFWMDLEQ